MRERVRFAAALSLAAFCVAGAACPQGADGGTLGREGKVRFRAVTDLAFTTKLVVGSNFSMTAEGANEEISLKGVTLESSDDDVLVLEAASGESATLKLVGAGTAELRVKQDGELLDAVEVSAAKPAATTLVDAALLGITDQLDARLPVQWAILSGQPVSLAIAAVDACGADLLDLNASTLEATGLQASVEPTDAAGFVVEPAEDGALALVLKTPGLDDLAYDVEVQTAADVDEARIAIAAAAESQAVLWGRAFANGVEVIGALPYAWAASERVSMSAASGQSITVEISMPGANEVPDDRPATVTVNVDEEESTVDLFALTEADIVTVRGEVARVAPEPKGQGCGGDATCAALVGVWSLRRLRKLRHA